MSTETRKSHKSSTAATVWIFTEKGRQAAALVGHTDTESAWAHIQRLPARSVERMTAGMWFHPAEINIHPDDVARAITKWETVAALRGVCHVEASRAAGRLNKVYA